MSAKKNVICVFSLILYLLVACTILSNWIEAQMMTQVKISERQNRGNSFGFSQSALFADDDGNHLYEMIDGTGWNSGLRARELPSAAWYIDAYDKVQFDGSEQTYRFIVSGSRQPQEGDNVAVVESFEKAEDQYLCIYTDGVPEEIILPRDTEIVAQRENILLLNLKEAEFPFFEQTAKGMTETLAKADKIFSITEIDKFLTAIPSLALGAILLFIGVVLLFFTYFLCICFEKNKWLIRMNTIIVMAILCYIFFLLRSIELPSSLLPPTNIFEINEYMNQFVMFIDSLENISSSPNMILYIPLIIEHLMCIVRYSGLIFFSLITLEVSISVYLRHTHRRQKKYIGKYLRI